MRKLRMLLLVLMVFVIPGANAIDIQCFPASFVYYRGQGWTCQFDPGGSQCLVCYGVITVPG